MEKETEFEPGYKKLNAYLKANELTLAIYKATRAFPKEELFGLTSQIRRSAISVPANIVEGYGRNSKNEKRHFYFIARGSLNEIEYYIDLSKTLGYINTSLYSELNNLRKDAGKILTGLIKSLT